MIDLMSQVDNYCERTDFQYLSEPLNFFSNGFFWLAAVAALIRLRNSRVADSGILKVLILLLFLVGWGSAYFHSFATRWGEICDVTFIGLFVLWFLWQWLHAILEFSRTKILLYSLGFFVLTGLLQFLFQGFPLYGSQGYFGVVIFLGGLGWHQYRYLSRSSTLLQAGLLFLVSLTLRTLDEPLCASFPMGTHVFWHSFNALVCFLVIQAMQKELERKLAS